MLLIAGGQRQIVRLRNRRNLDSKNACPQLA